MIVGSGVEEAAREKFLIFCDEGRVEGGGKEGT